MARGCNLALRLSTIHPKLSPRAFASGSLSPGNALLFLIEPHTFPAPASMGKELLGQDSRSMFKSQFPAVKSLLLPDSQVPHLYGGTVTLLLPWSCWVWCENYVCECPSQTLESCTNVRELTSFFLVSQSKTRSYFKVCLHIPSGTWLHLSKLQLPPLWNGHNTICFIRWLWGLNAIVFFKGLDK